MTGVSTREAISRTALAKIIDHTKLTFSADEDPTAAISALCQEADEHGFYAVCVRPQHVALAKSQLPGSLVIVATVIGFPQDKLDLATEKQQPTVGNFSTAAKIAEAEQALRDGADELDVVLNVELFKSEGDDKTRTRQELAALRELAGPVPIKLIVETDLLDQDEIVRVCKLCFETRMDMIKTSTGMLVGGLGATEETVSLIRKTIDGIASSQKWDHIPGIKASGGVRTTEQALRLAGEWRVNRIGTSAGISLVQGIPANSDY
jgi:deoxyribose-phosphate aldolase